MSNRYLLGKRLLVTSGIFPLSVGSYYFFLTMQGYLAGGDTPVLAIRHIAYANLMVTGVTTVFLAYFGMREIGARWVWYNLLIIILWAGFNDSMAMIFLRLHDGASIPLPLVPTGLGIAGLLLTRTATFNKDNG